MISLIPRSNKWEVEERYTTSVLGNDIIIEKGFVTDLATVPRIIWWFIPPFGRYTEAAVVHDYLYLYSELPRAKCDEVFLALMLKNNTSYYTAKIMYLGVRWFGWLKY